MWPFKNKKRVDFTPKVDENEENVKIIEDEELCHRVFWWATRNDSFCENLPEPLQLHHVVTEGDRHMSVWISVNVDGEEIIIFSYNHSGNYGSHGVASFHPKFKAISGVVKDWLLKLEATMIEHKERKIREREKAREEEDRRESEIAAKVAAMLNGEKR